jgi:hypothetical protein
MEKMNFFKSFRNIYRRKILAGVILLLFLFTVGIGTLFCARDPVLVVGDAAFNELYGARRVFWKKVSAWVKLFRPIKEVLIGENTGDDLINLAVKSAAKKPYCVLFPFRYAGGASYYAKENAGVLVAVCGGANQNREKESEEIVFIQTDREADLYRAGLLSAILSTNDEEKNEKKIAVFSQGSLPDGAKAAFLKGAKERGFEGFPEFLFSNTNYREDKKTASIVLLKTPETFLDQEHTVPAVLFSWIDPAFTASWVKVIFDDSLWALLVPAVQMAEKGGGKLPSMVQILPGRAETEEMTRDLKNAVRNF